MKKLILDDLNRKNTEEFKQAVKTPIIVVLDDIRSLHNIGSFFRTCDAFLIEKIYLCGITATPPNKEIHKTALGATETVAWEYEKEVMQVVDRLKKENVKILSVEQVEGSVMLNNFTVESNVKYALFFGNEVKGVYQQVIDSSDAVIEIPQLGTKHSLNVSVSGGIVIWDIFQKMNVL
ncbi:SpoU rRNA Methylase family protein [Paenimyroides ummariense]|uniref:SpoU rRNA Methylase family protein n=1 Tax=Paenimyroides ummariense TaxID=913024 RepID=A0A1I4XMQ3_9FLAO|nr:RNA methyltransferase [Paenimyroides ummariense]SFN26590.1 SpoU rRNA Methylase family protein [Paenimyroides ummariense]